MSSSSQTFPPYPPLHPLRLATAADIPRLAEISVLGYQHSEAFQYCRSHYGDYPQDSVAGFVNIYRQLLRNSQVIVIVAEDEWCPEEESHTMPDGMHQPGEAGKRVIVGVAALTLPGRLAHRVGQFIVPDVKAPERFPERDLCLGRYEVYTRSVEETEAYLDDQSIILDKLVVHPAYRRRGHATALIEWAMQLCNQDEIDLHVIAPHMGEWVFSASGFKGNEWPAKMEVPDDGDVKGFGQNVLVYRHESRRIFGAES